MTEKEKAEIERLMHLGLERYEEAQKVQKEHMERPVNSRAEFSRHIACMLAAIATMIVDGRD